MDRLDELKAALVDIDEKLEKLASEKIRIKNEIEELERQKKRDVLEKIVGEMKALNLDPRELAKALGLSVEGGPQKKTRAVRGTAVPKASGIPKYRSSVDSSLTWTGKGRKPGWIKTFIDNGGNLEDWLIKA